MPFKYPSMQERIIANSVVAPIETTFNGSPCWWWVGARAGNGRYGKITTRFKLKKKGEKHKKRRYVLAHRASREAFSGEVLNSRYGMHLCHPHPNRTLCVNPDHLRCGTSKQNNKQTVKEGRHRSGAKERKQRHAAK